MAADDQSKKNRPDLAEMLSKLASTRIDKNSIRRLADVLRNSVRVHRHGITISGESMAELLLRTAPMIPVRNRDALESQYGGMTGTALAGQVIRSSSRNSAAVGGVTGALASAGELAPPFWIMLPLEVVIETLVIASIEMKMVAELHEVYGRPIAGTSAERGLAILESWSQRKGVGHGGAAWRIDRSHSLGKNTGSNIIQAFVAV